MSKKAKIIDDVVAMKAIGDSEIDLSEYSSILESSAKLLIQSGVFHMRRLQLLGVIGLLDGPAQLLSSEEVNSFYCTRSLNFDGMFDLSPEIAKYFFTQKKSKWTSVYLNGIKHLREELAFHFKKHQGNLFLNGLKNLTDEAARLLSMHAGHLSMDGLEYLNDNTAESLGKYKGYWLSLNGIQSMSETCAEKLMLYDKNKYPISDNIFDNPPEFYECFKGHIRLNGLKQISDQVAFSLKRNCAGIELNGLNSISEIQASYLSAHQGGLLSLNGLNNISPEVTEFFLQHKGALHLNGIKNMTDSVAEILGNYQGKELSLDGLEQISKTCAIHLSRYKGWDLSLRGLKNPDKNIVDALNGSETIRVYFDGTNKPGRIYR